MADESSLLNLVVAPSLRRRGLARALLCCSMWAAARRGHALYTLEVRESNAAATALYTRCGLAQVGRRKGYYKRPREDAMLFSLERVNERRDELLDFGHYEMMRDPRQVLANIRKCVEGGGSLSLIHI